MTKISPETNSNFNPQHLPFAAVVEHRLTKQALLLLAIEPRLGGLALLAGPGTAKTTLTRSFHELLPLQSAIAGCPSHCDPNQPASWCSECHEKYTDRQPEIAQIYPPFINLPLNVTEDRLLGGLALEATLQQGQRVAQRGLLTEANRGVLYCDELNRLENNLTNYLLDSLGRGWLDLEREGLSSRYPTNFIFIGTFDPQEGDLKPGLLERLGLIVAAKVIGEPQTRAEIMRRALALEQTDYTPETNQLRELIVRGRELLPQVQISDGQIQTLAEIALQLGVPGNRADIIAVRAACAAAALAGRSSVLEEDLKLAVHLVLVPRATRQPESEQEQEQESEQNSPPEQDNAELEKENPAESETENESTAQQASPEELLLAALETELPSDILSLVQARQLRAKSGSRGETYNRKRGRHIRSLPGKIGQGRIALIDTLLAAAPFQTLRGRRAGSPSSEGESKIGQKLDSGFGIPQKVAIQIRASDLRLKQYKDKAGVLFIFLVDASGSMALNRMREAKGAVTQLLQQAYIHRDKVALVAFRGNNAEILLPPSQSVELAKRSLDKLPTGGGTPLAAALLTGLELSEQARRQGLGKTVLVLITDGRGNVLLKEDETGGNLSKETRKSRTAQEVQQLAGKLAASGVAGVVLDTQTNFLSKGEAAQLARTLGGRYIYMPRADARTIAANVLETAEKLR